jgi:NADH dehydrogenase FAD-containing subunit
LKRASVTIVGGGFAGLACANALDSRRFAVTLIDRKRHFEFLPNIHELLSGVKKPAQLRLDLNAAMQALGHDFVCAEVTALDPTARCARLGARGRRTSDYLLVAPGSADADYGVEGVKQNSLGFKSVVECQAIHRRLEALRRNKTPGQIVIIGAGLEGIEALGEILRRYRQTPLKLTLIEAQPGLLPGMPDAVGRYIEAFCEQWEVECVNGDPVTRITPKTVLLRSGRRLRSAATIWTGGPTPPPLLARAGLAEPGTWAAVTPGLEHVSFARVFIAGDAASTANPISKQAYHALDMGRCVATNIERSERGRRLRAYKPAPKPTLLAFGDLSTVIVSDQGALAGPALAAAKEAVFSGVMTQLDQRATPERLDGLLKRGRAATRELLWPALQNWTRLRRQTQLRLLK